MEVTIEALTLLGLNREVYSATGHQYDADTYTATWTFDESIGSDRWRLNLAGEAIDPHAIEDQPGEGGRLLGGGSDDEVRFDVLVGDSNGDGETNIGDLINIVTRLRSQIGSPR